MREWRYIIMLWRGHMVGRDGRTHGGEKHMVGRDQGQGGREGCMRCQGGGTHWRPVRGNEWNVCHEGRDTAEGWRDIYRPMAGG